MYQIIHELWAFIKTGTVKSYKWHLIHEKKKNSVAAKGIPGDRSERRDIECPYPRSHLLEDWRKCRTRKDPDSTCLRSEVYTDFGRRQLPYLRVCC